MRNFMYLVLIVTSLSSCTPGDVPDFDQVGGVTGSWKLTEAFISPGNGQVLVAIENGEELVFSEDRTFTSNRYDECAGGIFSEGIDGLSLRYSCDDFMPRDENQDGLITFTVDFQSNYLILTPTSGPICVEGCSYRYQRQ